MLSYMKVAVVTAVACATDATGDVPGHRRVARPCRSGANREVGACTSARTRERGVAEAVGLVEDKCP
jgi:hypothetical protein